MSVMFVTIAVKSNGQEKMDSLVTLHDTASFIVVRFREGSTYFGKLKENRNDHTTSFIKITGKFVLVIPQHKLNPLGFADLPA